jgi:hypothetical protein
MQGIRLKMIVNEDANAKGPKLTQRIVRGGEPKLGFYHLQQED